eukprot:scaffold448_cov156-Amphora_coffeaeformis.AAC.14
MSNERPAWSIQESGSKLNSEETPLIASHNHQSSKKQRCWCGSNGIGKSAVAALVVGLVALFCFTGYPHIRGPFLKKPKHDHPFNVKVNDNNKCHGVSPCAVSGLVGDTRRTGFGQKIDSNLIFYDEFSDAKQSLEHIWTPDNTLFGEGNDGFAYYTPQNIDIQDGTLRIQPGLFADLGMIETEVGHKKYNATDVMTGKCSPFPECATFAPPNCTIDAFSGCKRIGTPLVALNPTTSGRVTTRDTFSFTYGRLEARMRQPRGDWLWPAFWLMPAHTDLPWPDGGEIDLMEGRGNIPGYTVSGREAGRDVFVTSLHFAGNPWWHTQATANATALLQCGDDCDFSTDFFTVGLYWSDIRMYMYVLAPDGVTEHILWDVDASKGFGPDDAPMGCRVPPMGRERDQKERTPVIGKGPYADLPSRNAPFDQPFYLIFNLAVGGAQNGCPDPNYWGENAIWCRHRDDFAGGLSASTLFWNRREQWLPTWEAAKKDKREVFTIDWVKIWQ